MMTRDAHAQATDIKVKKPDVLLLLDTSGSMMWSLDGSNSFSCTGATPKKGRWTTLVEVLTGTVKNLKCDQSTPVESNTCRPYPSWHTDITTALTNDDYSWPVRNGNPKDDGPVGFCKPHSGTNYVRCYDKAQWNSAKLCRQKAGEWEQSADGLLDTYSKTIRFAVASFDSLDDYGSVINIAPYNAYDGDPVDTPPNCQSAVDGSYCNGPGIPTIWLPPYNYIVKAGGWNADPSYLFYLTVLENDLNYHKRYMNPQWSYWFADPNVDATSNWLLGGRGQYTTYNVSSGGTHNEQPYDIGVRNPRARPWRGRMIGFGPSDYAVSDPDLPCTSEDDCTVLHNEMVQQSVLGLGARGLNSGGDTFLEHNTPLAAMMRDGYEFMRFDNQSKGVHVPHPFGLSPIPAAVKGKIGIQTDPYYTSATNCRKAAVIVVTDGEPTSDLDTPMSTFSGKLYNEEGITTFLLGVGLDKAVWHNPGTNLNETVTCSTLRAADFNANRMCERSGTKWKFADVAPYNGYSGIDKSAIRACCTLTEAAVSGGSGQAYFPSNQTEFKQNLNNILKNLAGGTVSRTVPAFSGASTSFLANAGATNAPAVYYEVRSSMEVDEDEGLWRGHLERVRYACNALTGEPEAQSVAANRGDQFESNLDSIGPPYKRKFFTVVTDEQEAMVGTVRPNVAGFPNNYDGLFNGGDQGDYRRFGDTASSATQDDPVYVEDMFSEIDSMSGMPKPEELLGLKGSDKNDCKTLLGDDKLDVCSDRILRWYGGDPNPDGADTVAPSRSNTSSQCKNPGYCSPMGAIYKSSPLVVPPPASFDSDDQNFGAERSDGTTSFVNDFGTRPTMVYSQTIDGQLHAFVMSKNDFSGTNDFDTKVPDSDQLQNNELWTFIPPAIVPQVWPNFNIHSRLLDGQLTYANVVYDRPVAATAANWDYATVLLGASGLSGAGGFYYAIDVTNPLKPRFLWQMRTAGNDGGGKPGDVLFGENVPGGTITTIRYLQSDGVVKVVAVAILPGGSPTGGSPTSVKDRKLDPDTYWDGSNRQPRKKIRDWGNDGVAARSLTVVELKTGRILARMTGEMADNPRTSQGNNNLNNTNLDPYVVVPSSNTPFDSPISGVPVAYPYGTGKISDRIYVGDYDGTLWRVDLSDPDPSTWNARIAFDAYNPGPVNDATLFDAWVPSGAGAGAKLELSPMPSDNEAAVMGQPIQLPPLLSLSEDGDLVVSYSTGDQEGFNTSSVGMLNFMISFADHYDTADARFEPIVNSSKGVEIAFKNGGRVTGPLNIFDGQLYFSYFVPNQTLACTQGVGGICGIHYQEKNTDGSPRELVSLDNNASPEACLDFTGGEVVFGISLNQVPSCTLTPDNFNDPYLGGKYDALTSSKTGRYQLVFHTGQGGSGENGAKTKSTRVNLPAPQSRTRVRTWVSIVE
ncbi:MAG: hypothetical protein U0271_32355 [Polyangiaceae bacterium]